MSFFDSLFADTSFWVAVSTILCVGFIVYKARHGVLAALDQRADTIRLRLEEAAELHQEATRILEEYKLKSVEAISEADNVLRNAERRADKLRVEMEEDLKETMLRQDASIKLRVSRLEQETIETVKMALIDAALEQVRSHLQTNTAGLADLDASLQRIVKTLH
jgi:F0F1-type ATP synthase membrane subunit b/b'